MASVADSILEFKPINDITRCTAIF